jgi:hypothetical protein
MRGIGITNNGTLLTSNLSVLTSTAPFIFTQGVNSEVILLSLSNSGVTAGTYNNVVVNTFGLVTSASNIAYLTTNQSITLSGDVSGTGATSITTTLATIGSVGTYTAVVTDSKGRVSVGANMTFTGDATGTATNATVALTLAATGVSAGTYTKVTVNTKGLITSATNLSSSDVTTALGFTPSTPVVTTTGTYNTVVINSSGQVISATNSSSGTGNIGNINLTLTGAVTGTSSSANGTLSLPTTFASNGTFLGNLTVVGSFTAGYLDNTIIGQTTPANGTFTNLVASSETIGSGTDGTLFEDNYSTTYLGDILSAKPYFAILRTTGQIGSVNQANYNSAPTFRNTLDDGSGNLIIPGSATIGNLTVTSSLNISSSSLNITSATIGTMTGNTINVSGTINANTISSSSGTLNLGANLVGTYGKFTSTSGSNVINLTVGSASYPINIYDWSGAGSWIDLTAGSLSGIGTGGPGMNAWIAYAKISGNWFGDSQAGDIVYRNSGTNALLFGSGSNSDFSLRNSQATFRLMATFTGGVALLAASTGVTASTTDNSTNLATTAFVKNQNYLNSLSITGAATGTATGSNGTYSLPLTLATSGVTAGTYNNVVVNTYGIVTSASNVTYSAGNIAITATGAANGTATVSNGTYSLPLTLNNAGIVAGLGYAPDQTYYGTATINFGSAPGSSTATVNVSQTNTTATSCPKLFVNGTSSTTTHNASEHALANMLFTLSCTSITSGVGFTISAYSLVGNLTGTFIISYEMLVIGSTVAVSGFVNPVPNLETINSTQTYQGPVIVQSGGTLVVPSGVTFTVT